MIEKLKNLFLEEKFLEGACNWQGYSGTNDENERLAYSYNINICIVVLINAIIKNYDLNYMESIIKYHFNIASNYLEEQFMADTDEREIRYMYFENICSICNTKPLDTILSN